MALETLHQPTFTVSIPEDGETTDSTNGCISMVMGTAYNRTTLLYDQVHRRDPESEGCTRYPPAYDTSCIARALKTVV
jgi:hypothetical protein